MASSLNERDRGLCIKRLNMMMESPDIVAGVLATTKGSPLAAPDRDSGIETRRIAAFGAIMWSIGESLEPSKKPSRGISICDLKGFPVVMIPAGVAQLVVIGRKGSNIGMVAGIAQDVARDIASKIGKIIEEEEAKPAAKQEAKPAATQPDKQEAKPVAKPVLQDADDDEGFQFDADALTERVMSALQERKEHPA